MMQNESPKLPALRSDIAIERSASGHNGVSCWVIHDPLQHRYFQINSETKDLLSAWQEGFTLRELVDRAAGQQNTIVTEEQVFALLTFLRNNQLITEPDVGGWREIAEYAAARRKTITNKLLRNYVFFKVPLFRPQALLKTLLPYVKFVYTPGFFTILGFAAILGLYLVSRQWDGFISDFQRYLSLEGFAYFGIALIVLKAFHEMGHAITAVRFGCRVPTMGVAFFLLTPLLYTDVSDAWRLSSRRERLLISAAGIIVELMLASMATLAWALLGEGTARDIAFLLATTGWMMSLAINLNPLIKFDGYYLLVDLLKIDNLQQRSFALGKWKMREMLFSPGLDIPEKLSKNMRRGLIFFAWMTWIYRFVLFATIALLVYHYTFKLLGIFLFMLEIWLLVALPIFREVRGWYSLGSSSASPRRVVATLCVALGLLLVVVVPWSTRVDVPAVLETADLMKVYPGKAAQVVSVEVQRGQFVNKGAPIIKMRSPEIERDIYSSRIELDVIKLRLANAAVEEVDRKEMLVLQQSYRFEQVKLNGLLKEQQELMINAPISGIVQELNPDIHAGRWIAKTEYVALISSHETHVVRGYVAEKSLHRLQKNNSGRFIPEDLTRGSFKVTMKNIASAGTPLIDIAMLASTSGGQVMVQPDADNRLIPDQAQYLINLEPHGFNHSPNQIIRGSVELNGTPESLLAAAWNQVVKVFIRETGF